MKDKKEYKKAREILKTCQDDIARAEAMESARRPKTHNLFLALTVALTAIDRQIPRKPDKEADGYSDGELVYDLITCPTCGYDFDDTEPDYCPNCGQALDWSE